MGDKAYRALQDALKILVDVGDNTHAERAVMLLAGGLRPVADAHTRIHRGEMFTADIIAASLANNANLDIIMTTPATDWPHLTVKAMIGGDGELSVYEAPAFTGGTAITPVNHKFYSSNTWAGAVVHTPTVSNAGTLKISHYIPGGTGGGAIGGIGGRGEEVQLKPSTSYLIRLTNVSGQARRAALDLTWYESGEIPDA